VTEVEVAGAIFSNQAYLARLLHPCSRPGWL